MTAQQEQAIRRCEFAQRTGQTARAIRIRSIDTHVQAAIEAKYKTDERA